MKGINNNASRLVDMIRTLSYCQRFVTSSTVYSLNEITALSNGVSLCNHDFASQASICTGSVSKPVYSEWNYAPAEKLTPDNSMRFENLEKLCSEILTDDKTFSSDKGLTRNILRIGETEMLTWSTGGCSFTVKQSLSGSRLKTKHLNCPKSRHNTPKIDNNIPQPVIRTENRNLGLKCNNLRLLGQLDNWTVKGMLPQRRCLHSTQCYYTYSHWYRNPPVKKKPPWKVLFFGTDTISVDTLQALYENMNICSPACVVESIDVITVHGKPPVRQFAESVNLPTVEWPIQSIRDDYDVGVLVSFGHMIPKWLIQRFPYGIVNMHPSMLPRWRGASPIIHTVLNGDTVTGVSIIEIRPRHFDTGPILLQQSMRVPGRVTSFQLAHMLGKIGASLVVECLRELPKFERFQHEQDTQGIYYAHKILPVNANIDWCNQTVHDIDCHYRAISELKPLRSEHEGHTVKLKDMVDPHLLKVLNTRNIAGYHDNIKLDRPGTVTFHKHLKCLLVTCKDGVVGFRKIVIRKELSGQAFYNGYMNQRGWTCFTSLSNDLNRFAEAEKVPLSVY